MYATARNVAAAVTLILGLWFQAAGTASYDEGRAALDREDWKAAVAAFARVAEDAPAADAALYWQAYAYHKLLDTNRSLDRIERLETVFPDSDWRDDARALAMEIKGAAGRRTSGAPGGDDELKLMALNALMHTKSEEAIPILETFLRGQHSARLKERALFVLAQSGTERGYEILADTAKNAPERELRTKALRYLGVHHSARSLEILVELYDTLDDVDSRQQILQSFMIAGEKSRVLDVARRESDAELRGRAIQLLGSMDASNELAELYRAEASEEVRRKILQAFMVAGDAERLLSVARNERESESLREAAVQLLGAQGASDELWALYQETASEALRRRILRGLFLAQDVDKLAAVARDTAAPLVLRKEAVHSLGISGEPALPALRTIYSEESLEELKLGVLHALFVQQAAIELIEIARSETVPELKKRAIHWLSLIDAPEATQFMLEILNR